MIAYLKWAKYCEIVKLWLWDNKTISKVIKSYIEDPENFYKTNYKWKIQTNNRKKVEEDLNKIIIQYEKEGKLLDIISLQEIYNKWKKEKKILNYNQVRIIVRRRLKLKYQKPYIKDSRKPKDAEEQLTNNIRITMWEIAEKEWFEDSRLKNKKIKNWGAF